MSSRPRLILTFSGTKFTTPFPNDRETFLQRILAIPFNLKLDCIWLRGRVQRIMEWMKRFVYQIITTLGDTRAAIAGRNAVTCRERAIAKVWSVL